MMFWLLEYNQIEILHYIKIDKNDDSRSDIYFEKLWLNTSKSCVYNVWLDETINLQSRK